jgi:kynurenine formamidase
LLDYAAWAQENSREVKPFEPVAITVEELDAVAVSQGTEFRKGDILFIRSGWNRAYKVLSAEGRQALADQGRNPLQAQSIGIEPSEKTLRWLWEHSFAAVAGDQPSMEVWPPASEEFFLHEWLLAGWGVPIGELFDLEQLSDECRNKSRYTFFFSSMPMKVWHCSPIYIFFF